MACAGLHTHKDAFVIADGKYWENLVSGKDGTLRILIKHKPSLKVESVKRLSECFHVVIGAVRVQVAEIITFLTMFPNQIDIFIVPEFLG